MATQANRHPLENAQLYLAIEALLAEHPTKIWRGHQITAAMSDELGYRLVDTMIALAVLVGEGRVERVSPGHYRTPTATPEELIARLDRELSGDSNPT